MSSGTVSIFLAHYDDALHRLNPDHFQRFMNKRKSVLTTSEHYTAVVMHMDMPAITERRVTRIKPENSMPWNLAKYV